MAKKVDITEKLSFDGNPSIIIKGHELEVNADAATVLKVMGVVGNGENATPKMVMDVYLLIFPEKSRDEIYGMNLNFSDFQKVVTSAITLVVGDDEPGEAQTHTMT